jgi:signal transduction histidine kinase
VQKKNGITQFIARLTRRTDQLNFTAKIASSGVKESMSFLEKRKLNMINVISFYSGVVMFFFTLFLTTLHPPQPIVLTTFAYTFLCLGTFVVSKFFGVNWAKLSFFLGSEIAILIMGSYVSNSETMFHALVYLWLGTTFSVAFVLFDLKRFGYITFCFVVTLAAALAVPFLDEWLVADFPIAFFKSKYFLYLNFLTAFSLNVMAILLFQSSYAAYFKELISNLKNKNRELEEKEGELFVSLDQLRASQAELTGSYDLLKEKQNQLQALASNVPGVIFHLEIVSNAIIHFKYISPRAKDFFEYDSKDILSNANLLFDQVMAEFRKELYTQLFSKSQETVRFAPEFKIETPSGETKWLKAEMLSEPVYEEKKQINGVFIDITEEKNRERSKEKMQKTLLEISNETSVISGDIVNAMKMVTDRAKDTLGVDSVSIWLIDKESSFLNCYEHSSNKNTDYARDPIDLKEIELYRFYLDEHKVIVASDAHAHPATMDLFAKKIKPPHILSCLDADIILKGKFQGLINCEMSSFKKSWTQDDIQFINSLSDIVSLVLEIHERKKIENEIQRAYSLIISVFDSVEEGLVVIGKDNQTLECNNKFIEIFRVPPPLLNKDNRRLRIRYIADQLVDGDDFLERIYAVEASNDSEHKFFDVLHLRDGRAIEQFSQPFYVQGRFMGRIWSYRDITKRLRAEENLRSVNTELDTFIYRASHDIKGPLARLRGICNVARLTITDEEAAGYFHLLDQESRKLDNILGKLLVVKDLKTSKVKVEKVDFNSVINKSLKYLRHVQDFEHVNLKVQVDSMLEFHSDENLLELIFMNVIDNSIQFRDEDKKSINIFIEVYKDNNFVTIRMKDNGMGIDESVQSKIFDMHFRGTERSNGTGLGLYIVKTAVDALNGRVNVQSSPSQGTDLVFSFPYRLMQRGF